MLTSKTFPALRHLHVNMSLLFRRGEFNSGRLDRELLQSPLARQLTSLTLSGIKLSLNAIETLVLSPFAARLRDLSLSVGSLGGEAAAGVIATAENLSGLRRLDLHSNVLRDKGARALASSPHLNSLVHLDLSDNSIGGPGIRALLDSPILDRLRSLDLSNNHIGVPNVTALAKTNRPRLLRSLSLGNANLDGECAAILANSPAFAGLRTLGLGRTRPPQGCPSAQHHRLAADLAPGRAGARCPRSGRADQCQPQNPDAPVREGRIDQKSAFHMAAKEFWIMNDDLKGCSLTDVLEKLEKGKIGHRAAMEWLNVTSYNDLVEIMHLNNRLMPGHQPMRVTAETRALVRSIYRKQA